MLGIQDKVFNKTITMTINEIIAIQKEIVGMGPKRVTLAAAVTAAGLEAAVVTGYKSTIARAKLREAEAAVVEHDAAVADMEKQLPADQETMVWFARRFAEYQIKREALEALCADQETQLVAALEEAKKGAWKFTRGGGPARESSIVTAVRGRIAEVQQRIAALDTDIKGIKKIIDDRRAADVEEAEFANWIAGGPKPEYLRIRDEAEREQFHRECTVLKLPKRGEPYTFRMPVHPDAEEEVVEEWNPMSLDEYIKSLTPTFQEEEKEEIIVFRPSTRGITPAWIKRFTAARAAKKAAAAALASPQLVITEVA